MTALLAAVRGGIRPTHAVIYDELRRLARRQLRRSAKNLTLDTTALAHEAYLKLVDQSKPDWQNRAHFLNVAAVAMRPGPSDVLTPVWYIKTTAA